MNYKCVRSVKGMRSLRHSQWILFPLHCIAFSPHSRENLFYWSEIFPNGFFWCFFFCTNFWQAALKLWNFWKLANIFYPKAHLKFHFGLLSLCFHVQFEQKENKEKWIPFGAYLILTKSVFHAQLHQFIQFILQTAMQRNHTRQLRLELIDTKTD